jgi:uncharacterized protein with HEPN domain
VTDEKALRVRDYLGHIVDAAKRIGTYTAGMTRDQFLASTLVQDAVIRNLEVIGEAARNIELADPGFPAQHPDIAWSSMQGMRHRLAHGYYRVNLDIVWVTVQRDISQLLVQVERALAPPGAPESPGGE